jgi:hypothetical protein
VRLELLERNLAVDAIVCHLDLNLLCCLGRDGRASNLAEDRVEDVFSLVLHPLHPTARLDASERRVLKLELV